MYLPVHARLDSAKPAQNASNGVPCIKAAHTSVLCTQHQQVAAARPQTVMG